jgi:hypothetical protein
MNHVDSWSDRRTHALVGFDGGVMRSERRFASSGGGFLESTQYLEENGKNNAE